ncbi:MAG: peptidoglycan-binding protein [Candidatus Omnitrophota bacterium]
MLRKFLSFALFFIFTASLSGCATARKQHELEIQGLRNQVTVLESQLQSKDEEILSLKEALAKASDEKLETEKQAAKKKSAGEVKSRPNIRQIQIALGNAGYDPGPIDGKMGKQTRQAIKDFQRANNLKVDGKVGKRTWALLKEYLYKKVK